ncbi:polysaccharide biosynthesis/export family protein [Ralstonia sp. R-29]|uniref:polysaccharide biosynthesis/export family protein n=1 Tax=Ralstonia sp. R-29 TaxID=3404059 RepID=UPI003CEF7046
MLEILKRCCTACWLLLAGCVFAPGMRGPQGDWQPVEAAPPHITPISAEVIDKIKKKRTAASAGGLYELGKILNSASEFSYFIQAGDIVSVVVWDHPELALPTVTYSLGIGTTQATLPANGFVAQGYVVGRDGNIQYPYAGLIQLAGQTQEQAQRTVTQALSPYLNKPQVSVRVVSYRSQRVYLEGRVQSPRAVALNDVPLNLADAIAQAGGAAEDGDLAFVSLRRGGRSYVLDLIGQRQSGLDPTRVMLRDGDVVRIAARQDRKVFVMGEVSRPATPTLRNGRLSLNEALAEAGGPLSTTANPRQIYVIRRAAAPGADTEVYHLDAQSPVALALAEGFELQPKDVVYVDAAPIVRWSRFINLLLPTTNSLFTSVSATK